VSWHISTSEEDGFYGNFPTKDEAIAEGTAAGYEVFYVGKGRPPKALSEGIFAEEIVEHALDNLEEDWSLDFATFEPTEQQLKTLTEELQIVVDRWFDQYKLHPEWFLVDDVERVVIP
jgi:hypothetical protein